MKKINNISVIGMGYVGAPLALELAKTYNVVGYDIDETKINNLNNSIDTNSEIDDSLFQAARKNIIFSSEESSLEESEMYIVTVPTPINKKNEPDLKPLVSASNLIGKFISKMILLFTNLLYFQFNEDICVKF